MAYSADGLFDAGSDVWHVRWFPGGPSPVEDDEIRFDSGDGLEDRGVEGRASVSVRSHIDIGRAQQLLWSGIARAVVAHSARTNLFQRHLL